MEEDDQSKANDEKPIELTIYKPEDEVYQKLHLCEYLRELYEPAVEENEHPVKKKKESRRPLRKKCG
jgi:hypothetical protein